MTRWSERDEPVLRWLVENPPRGGILRADSMSAPDGDELPRLSQAEISLAIETLRDAGYVSSEEGHGATWGMTWTRFEVTDRGRYALELWPRFDALSSPGELADILDALAANAPTEEQAGYLRRTAGAVRNASPGAIRTLAVAALSASARSSLGG